MAATCRDCAVPYDVWPGRCPNCSCGEPAPRSEASGAGPASEPLPAFDGELEREHPGTGVPMEPAEVVPGEEVELPPDYATWTVAELRAECERQGLPTSGVKATLVNRLERGG